MSLKGSYSAPSVWNPFLRLWHSSLADTASTLNASTRGCNHRTPVLCVSTNLWNQQQSQQQSPKLIKWRRTSLLNGHVEHVHSPTPQTLQAVLCVETNQVLLPQVCPSFSPPFSPLSLLPSFFFLIHFYKQTPIIGTVGCAHSRTGNLTQSA
jgi:hypothetical protein